MMFYIPSLFQAILYKNSSLTLFMEGFKNGLKTFVSLNRDWLEGTEPKIAGFGIRIPSLKNESILGCTRFFSNFTLCHRSLLEWE